MRIQHNIPAMNAYRNYRNNSSLLSKNLEKLSSGYRINRAGDDAAGLAISEKMRAQISGLSAAQSNAKDGISLVQTAEGALTEVHDMLNRMVTLAEQSSNGTYGDDLDRKQLQKEVEQLRTEINRIADSANFNGIKLLDGSMDASRAREATSVTTTTAVLSNMTEISTSALADYKVDGSGSYTYGTIGLYTNFHEEAPKSGKASFYLDLNNYAVSNTGTVASGTLEFTIGSGSGAGTFAIDIASSDFTSASTTTLNAEALVGKIIEKIGGSTGTNTLTINGNEFNVSADGNRVKFESVNELDSAVSMKINIKRVADSYVIADASYASTGSTGANVSFTFANTLASDEKAAFIDAAGGSISFSVNVTQKLEDTASWKGASKTSIASVVTASVIATDNSTSINLTIDDNATGTEALIEFTVPANKKLAASTEIKFNVNVSNGTSASQSITVSVALSDLEVKGSDDSIVTANAGNYEGSTGGTTLHVNASSVLSAINTKLSDFAAVYDGTKSFGSSGLTISNLTTSVSGATVTWSSGTGVKFSSLSANVATNETVTFTIATTTGNTGLLKITTTVGALNGGNAVTNSGGNGTIDADTLNAALNDLLQTSFTQKKEIDAQTSALGDDKVELSIAAAPSGYTYVAKFGANGSNTALQAGTYAVSNSAAASTFMASGSVVTITVVKGSTASGSAVGSFTVNLSSLANATDTVMAKLYDASASFASADAVSGTLTTKLGYTTTGLVAGGDYNTSTEAVVQGALSSSTRLASTYLNADASSAASASNVFAGKIFDGAAMQIGEETYVFAVGASSTMADINEGAIVVDLRNVKDVPASQGGLTGAALDKALKALTVAAKDNTMYGVGYDTENNKFTLTENVGYYTGSNTLLNNKETIAKTIAFGKVTKTNSITATTAAFEAKNLVLQIGDTSDSYNQLEVSIADMHTDAIGIGTIDISTQAGAQAAVDKIKAAINYVSDVRGGLGATQNRLEHTINNLSVMVENITDAESTIRDTDIAEEMMAYTKNSILNQAAQAMLAQANQLPQGVLQLLG